MIRVGAYRKTKKGWEKKKKKKKAVVVSSPTLRFLILISSRPGFPIYFSFILSAVKYPYQFRRPRDSGLNVLAWLEWDGKVNNWEGEECLGIIRELRCNNWYVEDTKSGGVCASGFIRVGSIEPRFIPVPDSSLIFNNTIAQVRNGYLWNNGKRYGGTEIGFRR